VTTYNNAEFRKLPFTLIRFIQEVSCLRLRRMN
jgi:hypothetical protein